MSDEDDKYFYCYCCSAELNGDECDEVKYVRTVANGDIGKCPFCNSEVLADIFKNYGE